MNQDNIFVTNNGLIISFIAGYIVSSFNMLSFVMGSGMTFCIMKYGNINISTYLLEFYEKTINSKIKI